MRDLCRAREDAVTDRTRARHRLAKLLLRRGIAYDGRNWTLRHRRWLLTLRFEHPAAQATFDWCGWILISAPRWWMPVSGARPPLGG